MAQKLITGMVFRGGAVEWTTLHAVKKEWVIAEHKTADLQLPEAEREWTSAGLPAALRRHCEHLKGDCWLALPAEKALLRVVDLPTADPAEMRNMADLQVDKFSPFPLEHMIVSIEVLVRREGAATVLIVALQRDLVESAGKALRAARMLPQGMDLELLAWWRLLKDAGEMPERGRRVLLLLLDGGAQLLVTQDGIPVVLRALGGATGPADAQFFSDLAEEVEYTMTSLEAERGTADSTSFCLWHAGAEAPAELLERLKASGVTGLQTRSLESLPPLSEGVARRAASRDAVAIDLAPPAWRTESQSRRFHRTLAVATGVFLVLWLAGLGGLLGTVKAREDRQRALKAEVDRLQAPAAEVRDLKDRIRWFEAYADRSRSALESLREVTAALPQGIDLTSFAYRKGSSVSVRGEADTPEPIYDLFQALETSPFFTGVKPEAVRSKFVGGRQRSEFSLFASLPGGEKEAKSGAP